MFVFFNFSLDCDISFRRKFANYYTYTKNLEVFFFCRNQLAKMEVIYSFWRQGFVTSLAMKDAYLNTTDVHNSPVLFLCVFT